MLASSVWLSPSKRSVVHRISSMSSGVNSRSPIQKGGPTSMPPQTTSTVVYNSATNLLSRSTLICCSHLALLRLFAGVISQIPTNNIEKLLGLALATGYTPHNYQWKLALQSLQEKVRLPSKPLRRYHRTIQTRLRGWCKRPG